SYAAAQDGQATRIPTVPPAIAHQSQANQDPHDIEYHEPATGCPPECGDGHLREKRMVRFEAVGLRYGHSGGPEAGPEVLHDITFALPAGVFRWLLGPSGVAKTSLLRLMYLVELPTRVRLAIL